MFDYKCAHYNIKQRVVRWLSKELDKQQSPVFITAQWDCHSFPNVVVLLCKIQM